MLGLFLHQQIAVVTPMPPACAMAMASGASVTVFMSEEISGMPSSMVLVRRVRVSTWPGRRRGGGHQEDIVEGKGFADVHGGAPGFGTTWSAEDLSASRRGSKDRGLGAGGGGGGAAKAGAGRARGGVDFAKGLIRLGKGLEVVFKISAPSPRFILVSYVGPAIGALLGKSLFWKNARVRLHPQLPQSPPKPGEACWRYYKAA